MFAVAYKNGAGVFLCVLSYLLLAARGTRTGKRTTSVLGFAAAAAGTLVVAFSRLYLGYHWLTDVLASMGLALAVTGIVILADGLRAAAAPSGQHSVEAGPSESDAHRLGDHHRRG